MPACAEVYDPATGAFSAAGNLATTRQNHTATLLNGGMVLITAGFGYSGDLTSAEVYDPATGIFTILPPTRGTCTYRAERTRDTWTTCG